jgi:hypothetical protein
MVSAAHNPVVHPGSAQNPPWLAVVVTGTLEVVTQPEIRSGAIAEATTTFRLRRLVFVIRTANMIPSLENESDYPSRRCFGGMSLSSEDPSSLTKAVKTDLQRLSPLIQFRYRNGMTGITVHSG